MEKQGSKWRNWRIWAAMLSLLLSIGLLWSVRWHYTGDIYDGVEVGRLPDLNYVPFLPLPGQSKFSSGPFQPQRLTLPAFSDEWVVAGFVQKTTARHTMPDFHPLDDSIAPAENPLAPLILLLSAVMRYSGIDIVGQYFLYVFAFQLLFVLAFFLFLRACRVSVLSSLIGVMALLFLPESNVMPGIWVMLPAYVGAIFLMLSFWFLARASRISMAINGDFKQDPDEKKRKQKRSVLISNIFATLSLLIGCVLYPPFVVVACVYVFLALFRKASASRVSVFLVLLVVAVIIFVKTIGVHLYADNIVPLLVSFTKILMHARFGISTVGVWGYLPVWFYVLAMIGTWVWFASEGGFVGATETTTQVGSKEKIVMAFCLLLIAGLLILTYAFDIELMLSHQRLVFFAWLIMIAMAAYALDRLWKYRWLSNAAFVLLIAGQIWLGVSGMYQNLVPWRGVVTRADVLFDSVAASPVMTDMLPIDFESRIAAVISGKVSAKSAEVSAKEEAGQKPKLLAPPHVALAIAATTDMPPVSTVDSIVSVKGPSFDDFRILPSCERRYDFVKKNQATHVLVHTSDEFLIKNCPQFKYVMPMGMHYDLYEGK
jgi:hypothetical protein